MNATANNTAEAVYSAGRDAAGDFRRRGERVANVATDELRAFLADVEDLVKRVANVSDADVARVRVRVANAITDVRQTIGDTTATLRERARAAAGATDDYVRERPWTAIGVAATFGLLVGVIATASRR